ncbi:hypothetical protein LTR37_000488 [Vermiconidia calcicola]|uniref:Uncharacterized protein n=1 Tax=Vermiconidia calcicola TaxID=1690605 RepID=A0ACC3NZ26_9PEZI|nr:hypothetical protein LTR37_000488 [Vermiconidia calcicola]
MSAPPSPDGPCDTSGILAIIKCGAGSATNSEGQTANSLFATIATAFGSFGAQILIFLLLRLRLSRIYRPRSYLVPEKERVPAPPKGLIAWLYPLFTTSNLAFIQKCGLDAYFFLRYLRMLLKIFAPIAVVVMPILLPLNTYSGNNQGLDKLSISNIGNRYTATRLWAHLLLAIGVILWICYVIYGELRGYIRVRQAYLTSPQHRIKASATTVLVTGIPRKWLTLEALNGLYDVFPGGIRNVWINRNFDALGDKVTYRDKLAKGLEDAETNLVKMCVSKHAKTEEKRRKAEGKAKKSKKERKEEQDAADAAAERIAQGQGVSAGDQHDTPHGLRDALHEAEEAEHRREEHDHHKHKPANPLDLVGEGFANIGRGLGKFGRNIVGDVDEGFERAAKGVDRRVDNVANLGSGFAADDELFRSPEMKQDVPPTPPPKSSMPPEWGASIQRRQNDGAANNPPSNRRSGINEHHPFATAAPVPGDQNTTPTSETTQVSPNFRMTGPSMESKPRSQMQIEEPADHRAPSKKWQVWKSSQRGLDLPSPQPHTEEEEEYPFRNGGRTSPAKDSSEKHKPVVSGSKLVQKLQFWKKDGNDPPNEEYPEAVDKTWDEDQDGEPYWRRYLEPKERETMRVPLLSPTWCPSLPLIGKKVDRIYWLRRELARMNLEVEIDQSDPEKFPFMNSAFIQFNHQVAAHMACQAVSHHVPQHMAPRLVEISPDDVLWDNMSIKWWERYLRSGIVLAVCAALIILYAVPVTFTSLLSKVSTLGRFEALAWLNDLPSVVLSIVQGPLPPIILAIILALMPVIFRLLVKQEGVPTGNSKELGVQQWYFAFLFIQVFLVVTISGGIFSFFTNVAENPGQVFSTLGESLPKASNYFFSYLMIQALSNSASSLLQVGSLLGWFILGPLLDSTARAKWRRQTTLQKIQWGSFFPPFTNFAVIGIVYSVIAPLILFFMLIIFGMFWIVHRYNVLYVYQFRNDTGGLLFPIAVNQLFTGLYMMELCLIGFFFISVNESNQLVCYPQAIIMIIVGISTVTFQWLLNGAFKPLFQYLPITLEDEAVIRDEEFARAQASKFAPLNPGQNAEDERDIQDVLEEREGKEMDAEEKALERERRQIEEHRRSRRESSHHGTTATAGNNNTSHPSWHSPNPQQQTWKTDRWRQTAPDTVSKLRHLAHAERKEKPAVDGRKADIQTAKAQDIEAQRTVGDVLFSGFADELEDLTPEERDLLVRYAFQHAALRARRPVVWIPRDKLGVSDDEIKRAKKMSTVMIDDNEKGGRVEKTNIWMSNEGVALNGRGKVVFRRSPPDFNNVDLIAL